MFVSPLCYLLIIHLLMNNSETTATKDSFSTDEMNLNVNVETTSRTTSLSDYVTTTFHGLIKQERMYERIAMGQDLPTDPYPCDEGRTYTSLEECIQDCERRSQGVRNSSYKLYLPQTYKVLLLMPFEYNVTQSGNLTMRKPNYISDKLAYIRYKDRTVRVCMPLHTDVARCAVRNFTRFDIKFYDDGFKLFLTEYIAKYEWNEFFFYKELISLCLPKRVDILLILNAVGIFVSASFLALAIVLSKFIPDLKKNRLLLCNTVMLFLVYILRCIEYLTDDENAKPTIRCLILYSLRNYCLLSAFFWFNAQMYEMHNVLNNVCINSNAVTARRFLCYSAFCLGLPFLLTMWIALMNILEYNNRGSYCWLYTGNFIETFVSTNLWQILSMVINVIILLFIIRLFRKRAKEVSPLTENTQKRLFRLSVQLVSFLIVFYAFWILRSFLMELIYKEFEVPLLIIWCLKLLMSYNGLIIFIIYAFRWIYFSRNFVRLKLLIVKRHSSQDPLKICRQSRQEHTNSFMVSGNY